MDFYLIILALAMLLFLHVLYACLKVIGYFFKMRAFSSFMKRIGKKDQEKLYLAFVVNAFLNFLLLLLMNIMFLLKY